MADARTAPALQSDHDAGAGLNEGVEWHSDLRPVDPFHPRRTDPLFVVARALESSTRLDDSFFAVDDFMIVSWCRADRPAHIQVFKHVHTRAFLYLDARGAAYQYEPDARPDQPGTGAYVPYPSLRDAIDALGLWELPWLREDLAEHRHGLERNERFELRRHLTSPGVVGGS